MKKYKLGILFVLAFIIMALAACAGRAEDGGAGWYEPQESRRMTGLAMPAATPAPAMAAPEAIADDAMGFNMAVGEVWTGQDFGLDIELLESIEPPGGGQTAWEDIAGQGERHIIQTASVDLETEENFDGIVARLRQLAPAAEGYVESEMLTVRGQARFSIVLRVPAARFEEVLRQAEGLAELRSSSQWADDVTDRFYDMVGTLETRRIEEERVLALIEDADNIQDLLVLETRLSDVRLHIDLYLSQLNAMAGQIAFSTINVTLVDISEEDVPVTAATLGERIGGAFGDSVDGTVNALQGIVVFLAGAVIPIVLLGLVALAGFAALRIFKKKLQAKI